MNIFDNLIRKYIEILIRENAFLYNSIVIDISLIYNTDDTHIYRKILAQIREIIFIFLTGTSF